MDDLILPLLVMCVGVSVAAVFYLLLNFNRNPIHKKIEGSEQPKTTNNEKRIGKPKRSIDVSFSVWQGLKLGFGLGLGLILATGFFWIVLSSFIITSLASFMNMMTF